MSATVAPTRMNLTTFKQKKDAAVKGHSLLKQKADALKLRFRELCKQIFQTKNGMGAISSDSYFTLTEAEYAAGNFRSKVFESQGQVAQIRVTSRTDNVAGVKLPIFNRVDIAAKEIDNIGLAQGGRKVGVCKNKFLEYTERLIKLASLQSSFVAMDEALKITNRRVNALENVTIPAILETIAMINRELDELEREDFTRLKVVKRKKEEAKKLLEKLEAAATVAAAEKSAKGAKAASLEEKTSDSSSSAGGGRAKSNQVNTTSSTSDSSDQASEPSTEKKKKSASKKKSADSNSVDDVFS